MTSVCYVSSFFGKLLWQDVVVVVDSGDILIIMNHFLQKIMKERLRAKQEEMRNGNGK